MSNATGPAWDTTMAAVDGQRRQSVVASQRIRVPSISDKYMTSYPPRNHNLRLGVVRCPPSLDVGTFCAGPPGHPRGALWIRSVGQQNGSSKSINKMLPSNRSTKIDQPNPINGNRSTEINQRIRSTETMD